MSSRGNSTTIPNSFDVVGLGLNAMDYISILPRFPEPHSKLPIREVRLEPGGQVATALTTCRRLGLSARYIGSVGSDYLGRLQIESLEQEGLETTGVRIVAGATSQVAFILVEDGVGERTILWHRDERLIFPPEALSKDSVVSGRILHLDGRDSKAAPQAARWAKQASIPIVIDIDQIYDETTEELLSLVDYLIAAEDFALPLTDRTDPVEAARALSDRYGAAVTGITLGASGTVFIQEDHELRSPAFDVPVVDTTGAGDVFHGAFIYGVLEGWGLEETIRFSHAVAAMNCMKIGARAGIPKLEEAREFLRSRGMVSP